MRKRIVITGMGVVSPLGHRVDEMFAALLEGQSGVGPIQHFDARRFPTQFAAQVRDYDLGRYVHDPDSWKYSGVNTRFALGAAKEALADAGLLDGAVADRTRVGIYLGCGEGVQDFPNLTSLIGQTYQRDRREVDAGAFTRAALRTFNPALESEQELHTTTAHLAEIFDLQGPNYNCLTACAAGSQALGEAAEMLRHGDADIMLSGGSHSMIHPLGVTGFNRLTALSTNNAEPKKASRPFDLRRDGFVLGEGAAMLVLEELEHAKQRRATIYAELTGYGSTGDAFAVTDSHPEGRGALACIRGAMRDSGLSAEDIGYINAHGTSTQVNDRVETLAIKQAFGEQAYKIPVSSSKSMIGHLIAAAGAIEAIISIMAIRKGVLPPTINYEAPDPDCDLDYIPNVAREKRVRHVLSNSFGFGGQNVSLVLSQFTE
jgi:3-oxoacyl-[acyl-carrier-protein] synthase II